MRKLRISKVTAILRKRLKFKSHSLKNNKGKSCPPQKAVRKKKTQTMLNLQRCSVSATTTKRSLLSSQTQRKKSLKVKRLLKHLKAKTKARKSRLLAARKRK